MLVRVVDPCFWGACPALQIQHEGAILDGHGSSLEVFLPRSPVRPLNKRDEWAREHLERLEAVMDFGLDLNEWVTGLIKWAGSANESERRRHHTPSRIGQYNATGTAFEKRMACQEAAKTRRGHRHKATGRAASKPYNTKRRTISTRRSQLLSCFCRGKESGDLLLTAHSELVLGNAGSS